MPASTTAQLPQERLITGEELGEMPDLGPCELVNGRIVPMPPPFFEHGETELNFAFEIRTFVGAHKLGRVASGDAGIYTRRNPDTVRGADVLFISNERYALRNLALGFLDVAPDLVVEVLSRSNRMTEMLEKLAEYFAVGVRLVWLVDPPARCVQAYRSLTDVRTFTDADELPGDDVLPGFSLPVSRFFE